MSVVGLKSVTVADHLVLHLVVATRRAVKFHTGAFNPGVPVQPVVIKYHYKHFSPAMESISGKHHILRLMTQFFHRCVVWSVGFLNVTPLPFSPSLSRLSCCFSPFPFCVFSGAGRSSPRRDWGWVVPPPTLPFTPHPDDCRHLLVAAVPR